MRISHYWPRHGGNVMALVLHRSGEMGKSAMSLLLRLALHSGEDRHLRRITIIIIITILLIIVIIIVIIPKGKNKSIRGDFLQVFFRDVVVSLITDVMLPVSFGSVVGWCGFHEFVQLFRKCFWSKYDMKDDFLVSLEH